MAEINKKRIWIVGPKSRRVDLMRQMLIGQGYNPVVHDPVLPDYAQITKEDPLLIILLSQISLSFCEQYCRKIAVLKEEDVIPVLLVCSFRADLSWTEGLLLPLDVIHTPYLREGFLLKVKQIIRHRVMERELAKARHELVQAQRMECIGALAAGVAHEFNNLMFAVMGFAEMAKSGGGNDLDALRESAEVSYEAAQRAATIASSLLAFTRQAQSDKNAANLNDAVNCAIKLLRKNIEHDGINLVCKLGNIPDSFLAIGPVQQVALNLLINAWHAMRGTPGKRQLTVTTKLIDDDVLQLRVKDSGVGIPEEMIEKIFEPFFTTKNKYAADLNSSSQGKEAEGTGLGLAIVRQVINSHGGSVDVKSVVGKGSEFVVSLPYVAISDDSVQEAEDVEIGHDLSRQWRIIVIDDDEGSRQLLSRLLTRYGYLVWTASSMVESHHLIWSHKVDLLLIDIVLAGENGIECCRQLRQDGFSMPIVLYTGMLHRDSREEALAAGANGLLYKPFRREQLLQTIDDLLEKKDQDSEAEE